jgi:hypothetical protein
MKRLLPLAILFFLFLIAFSFGSPVEDISNAVNIFGGDGAKVSKGAQKVLTALGVIFPALYFFAALDPSNKLVKGLDKLNKLLKLFGPLDKNK